MSTEKRWDGLEGEALGMALAEAMGWERCLNSTDRDWWGAPDHYDCYPVAMIVQFRVLTRIVWKQHLKPRGGYRWTLDFDESEDDLGVLPAVATVYRNGCFDTEGCAREPEVALARALGEALEAGE